MRTLVILCLLAVPAVAGASPLDKLTAEDLKPYTPDVNVEAPFKAGERFLKDLEQRDPGVAAALVDAATVRFHDTEARRFANDRRSVIIAYGVLFALLVGFVVTLYLRQQKLNQQLSELEAKLAAGKTT